MGIIGIYDAHGTFLATDEPSYDILGRSEERLCLFKYIKKSYIYGLGKEEEEEITDIKLIRDMLEIDSKSINEIIG